MCRVDRVSPGSGTSLCSRVLSRVSFFFLIEVVCHLFSFYFSLKPAGRSLLSHRPLGVGPRGGHRRLDLERRNADGSHVLQTMRREEKRKREKGRDLTPVFLVFAPLDRGAATGSPGLSELALNSQSGSLTPSNLFI